jgi:tetratricopeptide (TPR) repeat protein
VDYDVLLKDVSELGKGPEISLSSAVPFQGKWADQVFVANPISNAVTYLAGRYFDDARGLLEDYLQENGRPPGVANEARSHAQNMQQAEVYYVLGEAERLSGSPAKAIAHYEKSLQYNARQILVLNQVACLLATNEDPGIRNGAKAVIYAEFMMRAPKVPENVSLPSTVAAAYASAGKFSEALKVQRERLRKYEKSESLTE